MKQLSVKPRQKAGRLGLVWGYFCRPYEPSVLEAVAKRSLRGDFKGGKHASADTD